MSDLDYSSDDSTSSLDSYSSNSSISSDEVDYQENNLQLEGKILREYNIITELGRGGYSIVWLGYNTKDKKYYAIKIQHSDDFRSGLDEARLMRRLPKDVNLFNHMLDSFIYTVIEESKSKKRNSKIKKKRYLCSVYNLHAGNLDGFLRKGKYIDGYEQETVKKIAKQLFKGLNILHKKIKVFHGDIKPDNILVKGVNNRDAKLIKLYNKCNFENLVDIKLLENKEKGIDEDIDRIKRNIHKLIVKNIKKKITKKDSKYELNDKYIDNISISISDFGDFCDEEDKFDEEFGTRYYRSPEGILMAECDNKVDIWAAGCTIYELLTGTILFDPEKDKKRDRDHYHLYYINCYCGNFPKRFLKNTEKWKKYFSKSGELKDFEIESTSFFEADKINLEEFFSSILEINPVNRPSADMVLNHTWLK